MSVPTVTDFTTKVVVNTQKVITFADLGITSTATVTSLAIDTDVTAGTLAVVYNSPGQVTNAFTYDPAQDASGTAVTTFTYTATNAEGASTPATVTIDVGTLPTAVTPTTLAVNLVEDTTRIITITELGLTENGTISALTKVSDPSIGTLSVITHNNEPAFQYVPDGNANGNDSFTYTATNEFGTTATLTVDFTIGATNDSPSITSTAVTAVNQDALYTYNITSTDIDGQSLTISSANTLPGWLTLTTTTAVDASGVLTGTPTNSDVGTHAISLEVTDGTATAVQTFNIVVSNINDAPVAGAVNAVTNEDSTGVTITLNGVDVDSGDTLAYFIESLPSNGGLESTLGANIGTGEITGGSNRVVYKPSLHFNGTDSFTYKVNDGTVDSTTATVDISVNPVDDAPSGQPVITGTVTQNSTLTADTTGIADIDGLTNATFTYQWSRTGVDISGATNSTYTLVEADVGKTMVVTVNFTDDDGTANTLQSQSSAAVANVNDAPTFASTTDTLSAIVNIPISYTTVPSDVDVGDSLTYTFSQSTQGSVDWLDFSSNTLVISGTPPPGSEGANTITVIATDSGDLSANFELTVNVASNNAPQKVGSDPSGVNVLEDASPTVIDLSTHFTENDSGDTLTFSSSITSQTPSDLLSVGHSGAANKDMTITYGANKHGTATILATATDLSGHTVDKTFDIVVESVDDADPALNQQNPFVDIQGFSDVLRLNPVTVDLSGKFLDVDGDAITFSILSNDLSLVTLSSISGDNTFTVAAAGVDVDGSTTVQVTASDASGTTTVPNAFKVDVSGVLSYISNLADITVRPMSFFNTQARISAITSAQIPNLSATQISNLTPTQASQLSTDQVADFSANVTPMPYTSYDNLSHAAASNAFLTGSAINFNESTLRSQQVSTIKQFNKATLEALTPTLFKVLDATQIGAFESQQIPYIGSPLLQALDQPDASGSIINFSTATSDRYRDATQEFSGSQLTGLTSTQVGLLSGASRLQWYNPTKLADIDSSVFGSVNEVQFDTFDAAQFAAFDVSALSGMSQAQFDKLAVSTNNLFVNLTDQQLQAIPSARFGAGATVAAHISRLDGKIPDLTSLQIGNIEPAVGALASLSLSDISGLSLASVAALTSSFVTELTDTQRNDGFTSSQIPSIQVTAINALTATDISNLDVNFIASLNASQVSGITGDLKIQAIKVQHLDSIQTELTNAQISKLSQSQIESITTPSQIEALSDVSKLQHLTTTQTAFISGAQFADIKVGQFDSFSSAQMAAFSDTALVNMTQAQFDKLALTTTNLFSGLDAAAINSIPDARWQQTVSGHIEKLGSSFNLLTSAEFLAIPSAVVNSSVTESQLQDISTGTISAFTNTDISNLDISLVNLLTPTQIAVIPTTAFAGFQTSKILAFDVSFINALQQPQVRSFSVAGSPSQLQSLSVKDLSDILDLSNNQIGNLTPTQVTSLSASDINALGTNSLLSANLTGTNQIAAISVAQIPSVPDAEITAFNAQQVGGLTTDVIQALDISQVEALGSDVASLTASGGEFPLTVNQIGFLNTTLVLPSVTSAQLQTFTAPQVTALSRPQLSVIKDNQTLNAFLATQITNLTVADHFEDSVDASGIINDVAEFDQTRFGGFNLSQLVNLLDNHTDKFIALTSAQKDGITAAFQALAYLDVQSVSVDKLAYLTTDQLLSVTAAQVVGNTSTLSTLQADAMGKNLRTKTATDLSNLDVSVTKQAYDVSYTNTAIPDPFIKAFRDLTDAQIGGFAPSIMTIVNDANAGIVAQLTASEIDKFSAETFGDLSINDVTDAVFEGLSDATYSNISIEQGPLLDASNVVSLDVSFALLSPTMVDTLQVSVIPFINAASITEAQANAFTTTQAAAFTDAQTALFTATVLTILSDTAGFDFTTTPLEFKLRQLNTDVDVQSMQITITSSDLSQNFDYDATVQSYMTLADAKKMFLYRYSNESEVRLYVDKRNFNIHFDYLECNHLDLSDGDPIIGTHNMKFSDTAVDNSSVALFTDSTNTQGNLGFIGNVAVNPITDDTRMPFTWDYIHYTAREVLGVFSAYPLFNNIQTIEETMRKNINDSIRQVIVPVINNIDISSGLTDVSNAGQDTNLDIVSAANPNGTDGDASTPYDQDLIDGVATARHVVFNNTYENTEEISATIFRTLMIQRKPDFNQTEEQEIAYGFPFRADDSMSFIVSMNPHADQKKVAGVSGTSVGEQITGRKYRINIKFTA